MSKVYVATVVAIFVTTSFATGLVVGAREPAAPGLSARLRLGARRLSRHLKHFMDGRVAAMIARRERLAARSVLYRMSDRDLKDLGLDREAVAARDVHGRPARKAGARTAPCACRADRENLP